MLTAITRPVSPSIGDCELTWLPRQPIDFAAAARQHADYQGRLRALGVEVVSLPVEPGMPDAVFVEDTAIVLDEIAIIAPMGTEKRRHEVQGIVDALARFRPVVQLPSPARLEGGDVMRVDRRLFVGCSGRTDLDGIGRLDEAVAPYGYQVIPVEAQHCLHFKTGCTYLGRNTCLVNPAWAAPASLAGLDFILVAPGEPWAANVLVVGDQILMPAAFPATRSAVEARGFSVQTIDVSELAKAEAGLTCMSLIFERVAKAGAEEGRCIRPRPAPDHRP